MKIKIRLKTLEDKKKANELSKIYSTIYFNDCLLIDTKAPQTNYLNPGNFDNEPIMWRLTLNILYRTQVLKDESVENILNILIKLIFLIALIYFIYPFWSWYLILVPISIEFYNLKKIIWKN